MPVSTSEPFVTLYDSASSIPEPILGFLRSSACNSNVVLPHILKMKAAEKAGQSVPPNQLWLTSSSSNTLEFILSCTTNALGDYPIFITTSMPYSQLTEAYLEPRLRQLAEVLARNVPHRRVFSVFAPEIIASIFVPQWTQLTGIESYSNPYYHAKLTFLSRGTRSLNKQMTTMSNDQIIYELRPAVSRDLRAVAELCLGFSQEGEPFVLTEEKAVKEATLLIQNKQVWVHCVKRRNTDVEEIASLVAFTRVSEDVATITKVYTNPRWRSRGCAERLVRRVSKHLIASKQQVALYVAFDNAAANHVYRKVGFLGLDGTPVEGVDPWMEIGFDQTKTSLGYW
ncbi:hypothetical protein C8J56DRAFT_796606 [Mycena floridula]|nr:hypothetical protein C8J56DRAFT_796606 [Mycena floridula]